MERRQHVDPDGTYVIHPAMTSSTPTKPAANPPQSTAAATGGKAAGAGAGKGPGKSKAHYITMMKTRVALTNAAAGALSKGVVIAAR